MELQKSPSNAYLEESFKEMSILCVFLKSFRGRIQFCVFKDMIY